MKAKFNLIRLPITEYGIQIAPYKYTSVDACMKILENSGKAKNIRTTASYIEYELIDSETKTLNEGDNGIIKNNAYERNITDESEITRSL